jgi:hypothetical protein
MIYDNGTVTQQSTLLNSMAKKAQQFDKLADRERVQGAFNAGQEHGVSKMAPVVDSLAEELALTQQALQQPKHWAL